MVVTKDTTVKKDQVVVNDPLLAAPSGGVASIANNDTTQNGGVGGAVANSISRWSADLGTTETTTSTSPSIIPTTPVNRVGLAAFGVFIKTIAVGDMTFRIKEGATVLVSATAVGLAVGQDNLPTIQVNLLNVSVATHTYTATVQASTAGIIWMVGPLVDCMVSASCSACVCT